MSRPICKYARMIDVPWRVGQIVQKAFAAATTGRPGPVHLALPLDVAAVELEALPPRSRQRSGNVKPSAAADPELIATAAEMLTAAQRPVLIAGSGTYYAHAESALATLAREQDIPIVIPIWDRGSVPSGLPQFMGVVGAASGEASLVADSDLLLCFGVNFDYRVSQFQVPNVAHDAKVIRCDCDERSLQSGLEADLSIAGSPRNALQQLAQACRAKDLGGFSAWRRETSSRREDFRQKCRVKADRLPVRT